MRLEKIIYVMKLHGFSFDGFEMEMNALKMEQHQGSFDYLDVVRMEKLSNISRKVPVQHVWK